MRSPLLCLFAILLLGSARAAEPFFKRGDVIALVGGEDMVVASEYGYLELLLTRALPDYHLRFRNLAWEGDTVFEQRRDLNFPSWEEQLDKIGATVVICQFGQMESLAGKEKLPEFISAYEKLLDRFSAGGRRKLIVMTPLCREPAFAGPPDGPRTATPRHKSLLEFGDAIDEACEKLGTGKRLTLACIPLHHYAGTFSVAGIQLTRDGIHANSAGHAITAFYAEPLAESHWQDILWYPGLAQKISSPDFSPQEKKELELIRAKNRLWFNYWRPQNWAFLAGDRTNQPSSRDWRDPSKRWFPAEREEFLPLIAAKEKEIDALAAQLK